MARFTADGKSRDNLEFGTPERTRHPRRIRVREEARTANRVQGRLLLSGCAGQNDSRRCERLRFKVRQVHADRGVSVEVETPESKVSRIPFRVSVE